MRLNGVTIRLQADDWRRARDSGFGWYVHKAGRRRIAYVVGEQVVQGVRVRVYLNRFLVGATESQRVYHRDGNKLNFRRRNLVVVPIKRKKAHDKNLPVLPAPAAGDQNGSPVACHEGAVL